MLCLAHKILHTLLGGCGIDSRNIRNRLGSFKRLTKRSKPALLWAPAPGARIVFVDESGFMMIPPMRRTWAPVGQTSIARHY